MPMTDAEMARAVAQGAQQARRKQETRRMTIGFCALLVIVLLFVFEGQAAHYFPGNSTVANIAAVVAIVLPWVVFWKVLAR